MNGDEDEIVVVDPSCVDKRTFPEKVYDMVSKESEINSNLVQWIHDGEAFSVADKEGLPELLKKYIDGKLTATASLYCILAIS